MAAKKRKGNPLWSWLPIIARLAIGGVLLYAGILKLNNAADFALDIEHYKMLPEPVINFMAIVMPWNEVVIGSMLMLALWPRAVSLLSAALFMIFGIAVTQAILRHLNIECGCFGKAGSTQIGLKHLLLDAGGVLLSLWSYAGALAQKKR